VKKEDLRNHDDDDDDDDVFFRGLRDGMGWDGMGWQKLGLQDGPNITNYIID